MKKTLTALGLITLAGISANVQADAAKALQSFRAKAPADTVFYLESAIQDAQMYPASPLSQSSQIEQMIDQFENGESEEILEMKGWLFIRSVLKQVADEAVYSEDLVARYKLDEDGGIAFYLDGVMPVLHLSVNSPGPVEAMLIQASTDAGLRYAEETWQGRRTLVWELSDDPGIRMAAVLENDLVSLGFYFSSDSQQRREIRLGLQNEPRSLADINLTNEIYTRYNWLKSGLLLFRLDMLTSAMVRPGETGTGRDLLQFDSTLDNKVSPECASDYERLASSVPYFAAGIKEMSSRRGRIQTEAEMVLAITNQDVITALKKLNGHLADFAVRPGDNSILSVALGIDSSALTPVLTQLVAMLEQQKFSCPDLKDLQAELS